MYKRSRVEFTTQTESNDISFAVQENTGDAINNMVLLFYYTYYVSIFYDIHDY